MIIPGAAQASKNVIAWADRPEWKGLRSRVLDEHFSAARRALGGESTRVAEKLGDDYFTLAVVCALEDFFSRRFGEENVNIIDDYLKRRGWREAVPGRRYLSALRDSSMSLYEVVEVDRNEHLVLRDLLRGGDGIKVEDRRGSQTAEVGDRMGARVLVVNNHPVLSAGILSFPTDVATVMEATFQRSIDAVRDHAIANAREDEKVGEITSEQWRQVVVQRSAVVFTQNWLAYIMAVAAGVTAGDRSPGESTPDKTEP
ncbi:MAG: hypothetical protein ABT940_00010 [Alphaproteobacteria bacterium]